MVWKFCGKAQFPLAIRPKLYGNCAFPQNFHTMKLDEITVFYAVVGTVMQMNPLPVKRARIPPEF